MKSRAFVFFLIFFLFLIHISVKADHHLGGELSYQTVDTTLGVYIQLSLDRPCHIQSSLAQQSVSIFYHTGGSSGIYQSVPVILQLISQEYIELPCSNPSIGCTSTNTQKVERSVYRTFFPIPNSDRECLVTYRGSVRSSSDNLINPDVDLILQLSFIPKYKNKQLAWIETKRNTPITIQKTNHFYTIEDKENDSLKLELKSPFVNYSYTINAGNLSYSFLSGPLKTGLNSLKPLYISEAQIALSPNQISYTPTVAQHSWMNILKSEYRKVNINGQDTWLCISKSNVERLIQVSDLTTQLGIVKMSSTNPAVKINSDSILICNDGSSNDIKIKIRIEKTLDLKTLTFRLKSDLTSLPYSYSRITGSGAFDTIEITFTFIPLGTIDSKTDLILDFGLCHSSTNKGFDKQLIIPFQVFNYHIFQEDSILSCSSPYTIQLKTKKLIMTNYGIYSSSLNQIFLSSPKDTFIIATLVNSNTYCPNHDTIVFNQGSTFSINFNLTSPSCKSYANGKIKAMASGTNGPYSFLWNNSATTDSNVNISAGKYKITISDKDGCKQEAETNLIDKPGIEHSWVMDQPISCHGYKDGTGYINIISLIKPLSYMWTARSSTDSFLDSIQSGIISGKFTYKNLDTITCIQHFSYTISEPDSVRMEIIKQDNLCWGDQQGLIAIVASGGNQAYQFEFNSMLTSSGLNLNLANGNYSVRVFDSKGCGSSDQTVNINSPNRIQIQPDIIQPSCLEVKNGAIGLGHTIGGLAPYLYSFNHSTFNFKSNFTDLEEGSYIIKTKDNYNCQVSDTILLKAIYQLKINIDSIYPSRCPKSNSGQIILSVISGLAPFNLEDNLNSSSHNTSVIYQNNLTKGIHNLKVLDKNNCEWKKEIVILEPDTIKLFSVITNVSCYNGDNGQIQINSIQGGTPPFSSINWFNSQNDLLANTSELVSDKYKANFNDKNGCNYSMYFEVKNKPEININLFISKPITCFGYDNGVIGSTISGGTAPYKYKWNENFNLNSSQLSGIKSGIYSLEIEDSNRCIQKKTISIPNTSPINIDDLKVKHSDCDYTKNGAITVHASGGLEPFKGFEYSIDNGLNYQKDKTFSQLDKGLYHIFIRDTNRCFTQISTSIKVEKSLTISNLPSQIYLTLGTSTVLNPTLNFGNNTNESDIKSYTWSPPENISCPSCLSTEAYPTQTTVYDLEVVYGNCMTPKSTKINLKSADEIFIPNSFTPNNDKVNDEWKVYGIHVSSIQILVFNRVGELVFSSNDIKKGWDGYFKNKLESSTSYIYNIKVNYIDTQFKNYTGELLLIQ